jgi:hypothetical protein
MKRIWILTAVLALASQIIAHHIDGPISPAAGGASIRPGDCDPAFFEMTDKNLKESGSDVFYRDFIAETSKKFPDEYTQLGEASFFARHAFHGLDIRCSSKNGGCTGIPTCKEILTHVLGHEGDKVLARKVYFSMKKIQFIADAILWFQVSIS